jgi:uncharacterized protein (DUF2237 family)
MARNVLGGDLESCGSEPLTGFYRTGCCETVSTPRPGFPGLRPGDRWCLCASRWAGALAAGVAPPVVLAATHVRTLDWVDLADLHRHAISPG